MEVWKDVEGYENKYRISNYGNIISRMKNGIWNKRRCSISRKGYKRLGLSNPIKSISIHRLVAVAFLPNPENKPQVNHIDGNKLNNHISNIEWATPRQNTQHAYDNGFCKVGEHSSRSKLKEVDVLAIREMLLVEKNYSKIGRQFNVKHKCIKNIAIGRHWKHLTQQPAST